MLPEFRRLAERRVLELPERSALWLEEDSRLEVVLSPVWEDRSVSLSLSSLPFAWRRDDV